MNDFTASAEAFAADVAEHQLTVLHEDGLYRHLRFARPNTGLNHFDLVTWPGHLFIGGDVDGYVFTRLPDMFTFFRAKSGWNSGTINPGYWAQKLATRVPVKEFSEEKFRRAVAEDVAAVIAAGSALDGLAEAVQDQILDGDLDTEDIAYAALRDFHFRYTVEVPAKKPGDEPRREARFWSFSDAYEWDVRDWDFHFLRACHAIQWGIQQYDAARVAEAALVAS